MDVLNIYLDCVYTTSKSENQEIPRKKGVKNAGTEVVKWQNRGVESWVNDSESLDNVITDPRKKQNIR